MMDSTLPSRLRAFEGREWECTLTFNGVRLEAADRIETLEGIVAALTETLRQTGERANFLERDLDAADVDVHFSLGGATVLLKQALATLEARSIEPDLTRRIRTFVDERAASFDARIKTRSAT